MNIHVKATPITDPFDVSDRNHGFGQNGKGDANRSATKKFSDGYDEINWGARAPKVGKTIYRYK